MMIEAERPATTIRTGRVATIRLAPNEDLVDGIRKAASMMGFQQALVRSGLGSLIDANLANCSGDLRHISGPAVEVLAISGEVFPMQNEQLAETGLSGIVGDTEGAVWGGRFVPGENIVLFTMEVVLEEILGAAEA